ncbi:ATP-grasp domain-containing protein [Marinobacter mobilis]|uniref:Biotin carboxylase n=1 Tax=Marinobacter mobilis TaxID=488533 RepID=A0A1H2TKF8_9GAMM|nr:ATP-grasp domain-containing protein [Marinobacter mobilis]SDW44298.1 Biotin carboxylase [Marinobacter mobilis]
MRKRWVVHVGAGPWQASAIRRVKELGYRTLAIDGNPASIGFSIADDFLVADIGDVQGVAKAVLAYFGASSESPVAVVCTACEIGMLSAANLRQVYDLPGTKLNLARRLTNKGAQRSAWSLLASPKYFVSGGRDLPSESELAEFRTDKLIIKPVDSSGSRGITVVPRGELRAEHLEKALQFSKNGEVIIEEFIQGTEYTIESVRLAGTSYPVLVTKKGKVAGTESTVANVLKSFPLDECRAGKIGSLLQCAHDALGYQNGVCHTEVIEDIRGSFWLVETAGRGAGFGVSENFIKYASGYDYFEASLYFDLGLPVDIPPPKLPEIISAVRFMECIPGVFVDIVNESNFVVYPLLEPGTLMSSPKSDADRMAYFYVQGASEYEVDSKMSNILEKIKIKVEAR